MPVLETFVRLESDVDAAVALLTVAGAWDRSLSDASSSALRDCLAEHPEALIVDLSELHDPRVQSEPTWMAARCTAAALDPAMHVALCVPPALPLADRLQQTTARRFLPVYAKVRQARVAIAGQLALSDRLQLTLPPDPDSPSLARDLVGEACHRWGLNPLLHRARLVMSELAGNAAEHARTEMIVAVSRRGAGLHLSVADGSPVLPRLLAVAGTRPGRPLDDCGLGLRMVAATAAAWGTVPTRTGKVVWASLR